METKSKKRSPRDFKKKRGSPLRGTLQETPQRGAGSSGEPLRGAGATSEPTVEVSAKGRVEPVVRNLPEVSFKIPLPGAGGSGIPLQGGSSSDKPEEREGLRHLILGVGRIHLAKTRLSGCARRKLKKAKASQAGTGGTQQLGNEGKSEQGKTSIGACHLKGHLFKMGLTDSPICERCLEKEELATHILCDCEAIAYLRFRHLGHHFMEPGDYHDTPASSEVWGCWRGEMEGECTIDLVRSQCMGRSGPPPYSFIHSFIHYAGSESIFCHTKYCTPLTILRLRFLSGTLHYIITLTITDKWVPGVINCVESLSKTLSSFELYS
jgi:hypothetical protein